MIKVILAEVRRKFRVDRKGAAMVEYALLAGLIAVVALGAVGILGNDISAKFTSIAGNI
jgi:pilus assembly protein Flp/PilA